MPEIHAISIDFLIPFSDEWSGPNVSFHRWLPIGKEKSITRTRGRYRATLWFDKKGIGTPS
jgi:hypothetical protein